MVDNVLFDYLHMEIVTNIRENSDQNDKENAITKLEALGFSTGYRIIERLTREMPRFKDELDTMKYICKDFWMLVYKKQIDNLRTNHQGVYVLQDNKFRFLNQMSAGRQYVEHSPKYLAFSCGLIRGALANLGYTSVITTEVTSMPGCKFHIQVQRT